MLAHAVLREDAGFHAYQMLEAGVRQFREWGDGDQGGHILIAREPSGLIPIQWYFTKRLSGSRKCTSRPMSRATTQSRLKLTVRRAFGAAGTYICGRNDVVACPPLPKLAPR
jgi:hypothetical protein